MWDSLGLLKKVRQTQEVCQGVSSQNVDSSHGDTRWFQGISESLKAFDRLRSI